MTEERASPRPVRAIVALIIWMLAVAAVPVIAKYAGAYWAFVYVTVLLAGAIVQLIFVRRRSSASVKCPVVLAANLLLLLFLIALAFLGFETYYRFVSDETDAMADTLVSTAWYGRHYQRNRAGFRDNVEYAMARDPAKPRITFVGDSFTAGLGVKNVEDRFVNRIRRMHPEWDVNAIAKPGLETSNEVEAIHNLVVSNGYQLDLVVLIYNINDIGEVMPRWIAGYKRLLADRFRNSWLCRNSYFVNLFYLRWQVQRDAYFQNYFVELEEAYAGPVFDQHRIALTAMVNMTRYRGGRLAVVTFPLLHAPTRFISAHARMEHFWREHGVPHLDLLSVFSNLPPAAITVNRHDPHPNEWAHELAAKAIEPFLREQLARTNQQAELLKRP